LSGIDEEEAGGDKPSPLLSVVWLGLPERMEDRMKKSIITLYNNDPAGKR
jgi:hypothetical protein